MLGDLDPLCEGPQMVAPKSTVLSAHAAAGDGGECRQLRRCEALVGGLYGGSRTLRIHARLVARRLQSLDPLFGRRIAEVRDPALDGVPFAAGCATFYDAQSMQAF